jgi:hypothetical protein
MADDRAFRCTPCGVSWPAQASNYGVCPQCCEKTDPITHETPMDADEAMSLKMHCEFERFCDKRDALKQRELDQIEANLSGSTVDGPRSQTGLPNPKAQP